MSGNEKAKISENRLILQDLVIDLIGAGLSVKDIRGDVDKAIDAATSTDGWKYADIALSVHDAMQRTGKRWVRRDEIEFSREVLGFVMVHGGIYIAEINGYVKSHLIGLDRETWSLDEKGIEVVKLRNNQE